MNKKGFTLVELLAVIALLGLLSIMAVPAVNKMRISLLTTTYESRVNMIINSAINWADDHLEEVPAHVAAEYSNQNTCDSSCKCVTIGTLINEGYLSGSDDDRKVMKNPLTNENLNNKNVCVRYDTNNILDRRLIAYIVE